MADARGLRPRAARRESSNLSLGTTAIDFTAHFS